MTAYDEGDAPLDPAAERLRRKLVRLLFVSGSIMMVGLIAVFAAIVYKLGALGPAEDGGTETGVQAAGAPIDARIALPAGTRVIASDLDGDRALLTVEAADGATSLLLVDLAAGEIVGRYALQPE
jgi:hypothetical protein